jgi:hypothetical protein
LETGEPGPLGTELWDEENIDAEFLLQDFDEDEELVSKLDLLLSTAIYLQDSTKTVQPWGSNLHGEKLDDCKGGRTSV